ncbi:protein-L-isoaspartate O-methyltransferase [Sphingomonas sp. 1P06PA]|uniref:protein-L-isoaspartate O-methyltransferase family protein n=1 Tax=Sphingomonas sp. 1P06PA TaxID=554121 RepID=UPI0039A41257
MTEINYESLRAAMVASQLRTSGVNDAGVLAAMGAVPRERFVPAARAALAYVDTLVPLSGARRMNTPLATGRLLTELAPRTGESALVVGAATGYAAAVLARLGANVVALEEDAALGDAAPAIAGVTWAQGPLAEGWAAGAPYDLILVDGAIERIPDALVAQLADGGRLATGLVERSLVRLAVGRKSGDAFGVVTVADVDAAPLPGFAQPATFSFQGV